MKQKSLNILLALSTLSWASATAQATTDDNIMPAATTDPATDSFDLYIRDNIEDTGLEPNTTTEIFWESPDLWYRNEKDGGTEHEMPYRTEDHDRGYVYVTIQNRGTKDFVPANEKAKYLNVYYVRFLSGKLDTRMWKGACVHYVTGEITGGNVEAFDIDSIIPAGSSRTFRCSMNIPKGSTTSTGYFKKHYFSYLAIISDYPTNAILDDAQTAFQTVDVIGKRAIAQKGVFDLYPENPKIPNDLLDSIKATIPINIDSIGDKSIDREMLLTELVPQNHISPITASKYNPQIIPAVTVMQGERIIKPADRNVCDLSLLSSTNQEVTIQCKIPCTEYLPDYYTFKVMEKDKATGTIIGGATINLNLQEVKAKIAQRRAENAENKNTNTPRIESVYPSPAKDLITVKLSRPIKEENAYIRAQAITDSQAWIDTPIRQEESQLQIDISTLPAGATSIQLLLNKNMIDNNIILKK